ncbi:mitochondrial protein Pet127-domain-containing protein [Russula earlei]|uniref:Mitochondrial protein Pet127-domain-containing protein n=1 Tax=Russula earlei TaxID=71964 RepID=A0ACC0UCC8_9AGAM|nr:mitochondrial protein Pet127-domain-containing protein [Russula earlei]
MHSSSKMLFRHLRRVPLPLWHMAWSASFSIEPLSPGVQWLKDPRSQVYSFSTWLETIIPVTNFAFERLPTFRPSSRDEDLFAVAQREGRKYAGSTSSMSGLLSQIYYLISGDKHINTSNLSSNFAKQPRTFTPAQRSPVSVVLHYRDGVYSVDSAGEAVSGSSSKNILTWMGTLLEKYLTHPPADFLRLTRSAGDSAVVAQEPTREAYRYAKSDKFILRSQLDCFDRRLPGTGVFDLKTRAVMSIRHDLLNFEESSGYQICTLQGLVESFEKEYYDLIRSAFLKYSFQARIGNMDGVFVAYHNTKRIFGFQYIPLSEMDARLFGDSAAGDAVFEKCLRLLEVVLEEATRELPCQSIRLTAEKREGQDTLKVFLEPAANNEEIHGSMPVIQLDVSINNYILKEAASGPNAVNRSKHPWTILWSVSKSARDPDVIRDNLAAARRRAFFPFYLPKGVGIREMERVWHEMQFNPIAPVDVPFKAELFRTPPKSVQVLRQLSRKGRGYLARTIRMQMGRPKLVIGLPNDAQEVAPLVALAHGLGLDQSVVRSDDERLDDSTANFSTKYSGLEDVQEPVKVSNALMANAVTKNQETSQKVTTPSIIDASERRTLIAEQEQAARSQANPLAIPFADGDDFISESTLSHLEEMLSEDQERIAENGDSFSARRSDTLRSRHTHPPRAAEYRKSSQLIKELKRDLQKPPRINKRGLATQEERPHAAEGTENAI